MYLNTGFEEDKGRQCVYIVQVGHVPIFFSIDFDEGNLHKIFYKQVSALSFNKAFSNLKIRILANLRGNIEIETIPLGYLQPNQQPSSSYELRHCTTVQ